MLLLVTNHVGFSEYSVHPTQWKISQRMSWLRRSATDADVVDAIPSDVCWPPRRKSCNDLEVYTRLMPACCASFTYAPGEGDGWANPCRAWPATPWYLCARLLLTMKMHTAADACYCTQLLVHTAYLRYSRGRKERIRSEEVLLELVP